MTVAETPPQNLEAEENILGAVMLSEEALDVAVESVCPGDFYRFSHGVIFQTMIDLAEASAPIDPVTVADALEKSGKLTQVGGKRRIQELAAMVTASRNVGHYARIVKSHSAARQLIKAGHDITRLGYEKPGELDELMALAEEALSGATSQVITSSFQPLTEAIPTLRAEIKAGLEGNPIRGLLTGFTDLDSLLFGLHPGQLIYVAARPGAGKSALAQNIAENVVDRGLHVAFATLEMSKEELARRGIARESGVDYNRVRWGNPPEGAQEKLRAADKVMLERFTRLLVNDSASVNPTTLRAQLRRIQRNPGLDLVFVDYIQLMTSGQKHDNRQTEIAAISRSLKLLAKDLRVPVVALSQMNRAIEGRAEKRPQLSDLRESGALEQDADVVLFIHRSEEDTKGGEAELIVAKNRAGAPGSVKMVYVGRQCAFKPLAKGVLP